MRKLHLFLGACLVLTLACGEMVTLPPPTVDMNAIVAQTMAAYTAEAALTQAAASPPSPNQPATVSPATQVPVLTPAPTNTSAPPPQEKAPNPLPATHTGIILNNGECFNFDNGQVSTPDTQCDVWLVQSALFRQVNGAQLSGYVTLSPPTRSHCAAGRYEPGDLAVQTDMFMCFITNQRQVGFIVVRSYRGSVPFTGIVFDYWVFL